MLFACQNYFNHFDEILEKQKAGKHQGVRLITSIRNRNDLKLVKTLMEKGIAIRHIIDRPPFDFAISNNYFTSTIENIADGKLIIDNMLTNGYQANLKFYGGIFEKQWESGIDSEERIKEIEKDLHDNIDIFCDSKDALNRLYELCLRARSEILVILPSIDGLYRAEMAGGLRMLDMWVPRELRLRF